METLQHNHSYVNNIYQFFFQEWSDAIRAVDEAFVLYVDSGSLDDFAAYREKQAIVKFLNDLQNRYSFFDENTQKDYARARGDYV